jgi:hypothetical protein
VPDFGAAVAEQRKRSKVVPALAAIVVLGGLVWITGLGQDLWSRFESGDAVADAASTPEATADDTALAAVEPETPTSDAEPDPEAAAETSSGGALAEPAAATGDATGQAAMGDDMGDDTDAATEDDDIVIDDEPEEPTPAEDLDAAVALADALASRKVREVRRLYLTERLGDDTTTWVIARKRCLGHEIDGVGGWRLAHRRELMLAGSIGLLGSGTYWSYTAVPEDPDFAFAFDTKQRDLVEFLKQEATGAVVCVRER